MREAIAGEHRAQSTEDRFECVFVLVSVASLWCWMIDGSWLCLLTATFGVFLLFLPDNLPSDDDTQGNCNRNSSGYVDHRLDNCIRPVMLLPAVACNEESDDDCAADDGDRRAGAR